MTILSSIAGSYAILSKQEELELTKLMVSGDSSAREKVILSNVRFAMKMAYKLSRVNPKLDIEDLQQEAISGLIRATEKFDPSLGFRFCTYAVWWIRAALLKHTMFRFSELTCLTTQTARRVFLNLNSQVNTLKTQGVSTNDAISRIAVEKGMKVADVMKVYVMLQHTVTSFESMTSSGADVIAHDSQQPDELAAEFNTCCRVRDALDEIVNNDRDKLIASDRLLSDDPATLQVLGDELGISRERVRQLERRLIMRLAAVLDEELAA